MLENSDVKVVVADDSSLVRRKLIQILEESGLTNIADCASAEEVLEHVKKDTPDIFILDIIMPGMDGLELCRTLKKEDRFRMTPVLFVTGTMDMDSRWECFNSGGVDYIPKPFHPYELLGRVRVQIDLLRQRKENEENTLKLAKMIKKQAGKLADTENLRTAYSLASGMSQQIKGYAAGIRQNLGILDRVWERVNQLKEYALNNGLEKTHKDDVIFSTYQETVASINESLSKFDDISNYLAQIQQEKTEASGSADLGSVTEEALTISHNHWCDHIAVTNNIPDGLSAVKAVRGPLAQVFISLLIHAGDATKGHTGTSLRMDAKADGEHTVCTMCVKSPSMTTSALTSLWDDPHDASGEVGTGFGISIARRIIEDFAGELSTSYSAELGAIVTIKLQKA